MRHPDARLVWAAMIAAPTIWFVHFGFVYAAASLAIVLGGEAGLASRAAIGLGTAAALAVIGWIALRIPRFSPPEQAFRRFWVFLTRILAAVSAIGIIYQAAPAVIL